MIYFKKQIYISVLVSILFIGTTTFAHAGFMQETIWSLVNNVFGRILGLAGLLLNFGVENFVIGFGHNFLTSGVGVAVDLIWQSVRDIFNLSFIFALVYIGFKMILGSDDSNTKRWLSSLIMAALLINFSLYISKFIVDASNILATQIAINGFPANGNPYGISGYFMDNLGLASLLSDGGKLPASIQSGDNSGWGIIFGTAMLFIVASFVFAVGGIMLIIRFVALTLFMALSPAMFLGWIFPGMQSYTNKYWKDFLGRAFYAPVYLLLIYFAHKVIDAYYNQGAAGKLSFTDLFTGNGPIVTASFETTLPPFILSCAFLVAAVVVGKKMGADGGAVAVSTGQNLTRWARRRVSTAAGAATFGAAAAVSRNTVGRYAEQASQSEWVRRHASTNTWGMGRALERTTRNLAGASFDARGTGLVSNQLGSASGKGGYSKMVKDKSAADAKYAEQLGKVSIYDDNGRLKAQFAEQIAHKVEEHESVVAATNLHETNTTKHADAQTAVTNKQAEIDTAIATATQPFRDRLAALEAEKNATNDPMKKSQINNKMRETERERDGKITEVNQHFDTEMKALKKAAKDAEADMVRAKKSIEEARKFAQAEVESATIYSKQIAYMKSIQKSSDIWGKFNTRAGLGAAATMATGVTGLGAIGMVGGITYADSQSYLNQRSYNNLSNLYGANGSRMANTEGQRRRMRLLADEINSSNPPPAPPPPAPAAT